MENGSYPLDEKKTATFRHNHKLLGRCALVLALLIYVTYHLVQVIADPYRLQKGTVFEDYESFIAYMEQDIPKTYYFNGNDMYATVTEPLSDSAVYYDEYGNEISAEESLRRTLLDANGDVVCEFIQRNGEVSTIEHTPGDGTVLPITVHTYEDWFYAQSSARDIKLLFLPVYLLELAAVVWFYRKKQLK